MADKRFLKLWLKFQSKYEQSNDGVVVLRDSFTTQGQRAAILRRYESRINKHKPRLWKARIYEQPGNKLIFEWSLIETKQQNGQGQN